MATHSFSQRVPEPRRRASFTHRMAEVARSLDLSVARRSPQTVADHRRAAQRQLPRAIFDFVEGGAEDEVALRRNLEAFRSVELVPSVCVDVSEIDTTTSLFGVDMSAPILLAPTGLTRLVHPDGELAVARSAARHGLPYVLSSMGSTPLETVGRATDGAKFFQLYIWRDRARLKDLFDRCRASGFSGLQLTVDVPVLGSRERDVHNGMTIPPRLRLAALVDAARHPRWWSRYLASDPVDLSAVTAASAGGFAERDSLQNYVDSQFDPAVTWTDLEWIGQNWEGTCVVKGVLDAADARRCVDCGANGIIVSNHGGRQLDRAVASLAALPPVLDAVGGDVPVLVDGGVRRGSDIVAALALGAAGVQIGRPYLYGLAAGGEAGVDAVLETLAGEVRRTMALVGRPDIASLCNSGAVRR
jgi:L-lactate dehydrogenase (cytochrome)